MTTRDEILAADAAHVWHPYAVRDEPPELVVARAHGVWLEDVDGRRVIDGNSSWWVASLGHGHPRLLAAMERQSRELVHCALGGIAHEQAALLARELVAAAPKGAGLTRVFFTDNGSTSIEVALRIALQAWRQRGAPKKRRFVALEGAFHGDTLGAASLGGVEVFTQGFGGTTLECVRAPFPAPDAHARAFEAVRDLLAREGDTIAAVVVEPLLQGAAGMRVYDASYLRDLRAACDAHDVLLVVDEVFTGYGRTGAMWACERAGVRPDLMCLGKAFASVLPMGATLATEQVYDAFRGGGERALYYGHTFCGHPLGAAIAREVLAIYRDERIVERVQRLAPRVERAFAKLARHPAVERVRTIGLVGAADLRATGSEGGGYLDPLGWRVYREALARGAYLRPLGNTVYVAPPLVISDGELDELLAILEASIDAVTRTA